MMTHRILVSLAAALLALPCVWTAQMIAVYESEKNAEEYRGIYQGPLRTWLAQIGREFTVIGDETVADPRALAEYAVVMASSSYIVPKAASDGLTEYMAQGGQVIWIDTPAKCEDPDFRAILGLSPASSYAPLKDCVMTSAQPQHPATPAATEIKLPSSVGNRAIAATEDATVLSEVEGVGRDDETARYPAIILARHGEGRSLCYNWIIWCDTGPQTPALLADGLDYMLAARRLRTDPLVAECALARPNVRQPEPIALACKLFARADSKRAAATCEVTLLSPEGSPVGEPRVASPDWTYTGDDMAAAVARFELPTADLRDGKYKIVCRCAAGDAKAQARDRPVTLEAELWAALQEAQKKRRKLLEPQLLGTLGDYDAEPRTPEGRVDIPRLMKQIETAHMNMYDWLIWHAKTDWDDLKLFLPIARDNDIKVWVTLCPPSEQGGAWPWSEPYRLDFIRWADEIGKLSQQYDNLVALVIDDFWSGGNRSLFTPDYIGKLATVLREHNPNVAFLPTIYWRTIGDEQWMRDYGAAIDGIVFPYAELETGDALADQLTACREWIGPDKFLLINVYASGGSGSGAGQKVPRTREYMRKVLTISRERCDGIRIYCLPKGKLLDDHRYAITAELYEQWRTEDEP